MIHQCLWAQVHSHLPMLPLALCSRCHHSNHPPTATQVHLTLTLQVQSSQALRQMDRDSGAVMSIKVDRLMTSL